MFSLELNIQPKNSVDFVTSTEKLDDHLSQYEIFMCSNSGCRDYYEKLTKIKEHIQNKHKKNHQHIIHFHTGLSMQKIGVILK